MAVPALCTDVPGFIDRICPLPESPHLRVFQGVLGEATPCPHDQAVWAAHLSPLVTLSYLPELSLKNDVNGWVNEMVWSLAPADYSMRRLCSAAELDVCSEPALVRIPLCCRRPPWVDFSILVQGVAGMVLETASSRAGPVGSDPSAPKLSLFPLTVEGALMLVRD